MFKADQLRELIIKPALNEMVLYSDGAAELLIFTCAVESLGGTYLKQVKGPALGIYQMEPETHNDIWQNFIKNKKNILLSLTSNFGIVTLPSEDRLVYDLRYATVLCRLHYARFSEKIPESNDLDGLWEYYKKYYNTQLGAAVKDQSLAKYHAFLNN